MDDLLIALSIGLVAGTIDVIPMIIQRIDKVSCISAFFHWVVLGIIIPFVNWDILPWLKGFIIAELAAIPILVLVYPKDRKAITPILIFSAVLGMGVGLAGSTFIG